MSFQRKSGIGPLALVLTALVAGVGMFARQGEDRTALLGQNPASVHAAYQRLPISFEANQGQVDARARFVARGVGYSLFLTPRETILSLAPKRRARRSAAPAQASAVRLRLVGGSARTELRAERPLPGKVNYLIGSDPSQWRTELPTYARVRHTDVYPGIDRVHYGKQGRLEHDFIVAPGADPSQIRLAFDGARSVSLDRGGDLLLETENGVVRQKRPVAYQETDGGRRPVDGAYVLASNQVSFQLGQYDPRLPLIIDPILEYDTYVGGDDEEYTYEPEPEGEVETQEEYEGYGDVGEESPPPDEYSYEYPEEYTPTSPEVGIAGVASANFVTVGAIALDGQGNPVIAGSTLSTNFPENPDAPSFRPRGGALDAFVTKLSADGTSLLHTTFIGGSDNDRASTVALDGAGNILIAGLTLSDSEVAGEGFPTTTNALQRTRALNAAGDAFVTKLNAAGNALLYSTYLGGNQPTDLNRVPRDAAFAIAVNPAPNPTGTFWVTGFTASANFPLAGAAVQTAPQGHADVFVSLFDPDPNKEGQQTLLYSTYLGGKNGEQGRAIAVDGQGSAYVTGFTGSWDDPATEEYEGFPLTPGRFQGGLRGVRDAFLVKLNTTGLLYSTYLGGWGRDRAFGVAVNSVGSVFLTGSTNSVDDPATPRYEGFPVTPTALQPFLGGGYDAFALKVQPGSPTSPPTLLYGTYLGGSASDHGLGIALGSGGRAFISGATRSVNFPVVDPIPGEGELQGLQFDAFVTALNSTGTGVLYSTYLGGSGDDLATAIAIDSLDRAQITGRTLSADLPVGTNAFQRQLRGQSDAFVAKLAAPNPDTTLPTCRNAGVVAERNTSGAVTRVYLKVEVGDPGSGVNRVWLRFPTSTNCHLEYPLGTPVTGDLVTFPTGTLQATVYAVKNDVSRRARVEVGVRDYAGNVIVCDPVIENLELRKRQISRSFRKIPEHEHYIKIENGTPGLTSVKLWVNGKRVHRGSLSDGQVLSLDVQRWMRRGNKNRVRLVASGPVGATAVLLIGDSSVVGSAPRVRAGAPHPREVRLTVPR